MRAGAVVLAAGAGRRFGGAKQLATFRGRALLEHALAAVTDVEPRVVVLGAGAQEILARVDLQGARAVLCAGWAEGQAASLRAGVAALAGLDAVVVTLGDQPLITRDVVAGALAHHDADALRTTYGGVPGHPVVLGPPVLERVGELRGDVGARELLARFRVRDWEAGPGGGAVDIDTREELARL